MIDCASSTLYSDIASAQSKSNCFGSRASPLLLPGQLRLDSGDESFGESGCMIFFMVLVHSMLFFMLSFHLSLMLPDKSEKTSSPSLSKARSSS
uniref:Uncharacterized protein n=1 Tax=Arundo donax TaxID=35708 RepID=A0A0A9CYU9_ARUDO